MPGSNEKGKKSILLRLSSESWSEVAAWADEEFRSINGQLEYIINEALKQRKKGRNGHSGQIYPPQDSEHKSSPAR